MNDREKIDLLTTNLNNKFYLQPKYIKKAKDMFDYRIPMIGDRDDIVLWDRPLFIKVEGKVYRYLKEDFKNVKVITSDIHPDSIYNISYDIHTDYRSGYPIKTVKSVKRKQLPVLVNENDIFRGNNITLRKVADKIFDKYSKEKIYITTGSTDCDKVRVDCSFTVFAEEVILSTPVYQLDCSTFTQDILEYLGDDYDGDVRLDMNTGNILPIYEGYLSKYMIINSAEFKNCQLVYKYHVTCIDDFWTLSMEKKENFYGCQEN